MKGLTKEQMLRHMLEQNRYEPVYELLRYATNTGELESDGEAGEFSDSALVRMIGSVRNHLLFISKYGGDLMHVEDEDGCHHFAFPDKLEEWLALDAPGLTLKQVEAEYEKSGGQPGHPQFPAP